MTVAACKFIGLSSRDAKDDPEDVRTATVRLHELAADVVERFGGTVVRVPGDALLIYFGYPEAREDDPERAVRAALELVRTMRRVEVAPPAPQCPRVGIASGTMLVGGIDAPQEWFGEPLNLALALRSAVPSESGVVIASSQRPVHCFSAAAPASSASTSSGTASANDVRQLATCTRASSGASDARAARTNPWVTSLAKRSARAPKRPVPRPSPPTSPAPRTPAGPG